MFGNSIPCCVLKEIYRSPRCLGSHLASCEGVVSGTQVYIDNPVASCNIITLPPCWAFHMVGSAIIIDHRHAWPPPPCLYPYNWVSGIVIAQQQWQWCQVLLASKRGEYCLAHTIQNHMPIFTLYLYPISARYI